MAACCKHRGKDYLQGAEMIKHIVDEEADLRLAWFLGSHIAALLANDANPDITKRSRSANNFVPFIDHACYETR